MIILQTIIVIKVTILILTANVLFIFKMPPIITVSMRNSSQLHVLKHCSILV